MIILDGGISLKANTLMAVGLRKIDSVISIRAPKGTGCSYHF